MDKVELEKKEAQADLDKMMGQQRSDFQKSKEAVMSEEEKKTLEADKLKAKDEKDKSDAQAEKDKVILEKKEEELPEEDKKRKDELLEAKRKADEAKLSSDEKIKHIKEETQKRIDTISNELKQMKDKGSKETGELRGKLDVLEKEKQELKKRVSPAVQEELESELDKEESERVSKFLKEDESKSREKRREMSKEELETWLVEDIVAASEWLSDRKWRREKDRYASRQKRGQDSFVKAQEESFNKTLVKHPEMDPKKLEARISQLKNEGKEQAEVEETSKTEFPKAILCLQIAAEHPEWQKRANGPELVMAEMEKRLASSSGKEDDESKSEVAELNKKLEDLSAELDKIKNQDEGINSTTTRTRASGEMTDPEKELVSTMKSTGASQVMIDSALKKFRARKGK